MEPLSVLELAYETDFTIETVRFATNMITISSEVAAFNLQISLESNTDRDVATLLLRHFHDKFKEAPDQISRVSELDYRARKE